MQEVQQQTQRQMQQQHLPSITRFPSSSIASVSSRWSAPFLHREADRLGLQASDDDLRRELSTGPLSQYVSFPGGKYIGDQQYMNFVEQFFGVGVSAASKRRSRRILELRAPSRHSSPVACPSLTTPSARLTSSRARR